MGDGHPGDVEARRRAVHGHVPPQGVPPLVHRGGHGRDGVHRGRVEHERPRVRVPAVPGCHRRGGGRVRRGRGGRGGLNLPQPLNYSFLRSKRVHLHFYWIVLVTFSTFLGNGPFYYAFITAL